MESQLECIINDTGVSCSVNPGIVLLDFLRQHEHLTGTKEGCREGDCGACTVLVGELRGTDVVYTSVNSCLLPLGDVQGKHVVTIEGINRPAGLTPVQTAFVEEGSTQCGFCTPGFILSLTGYCIAEAKASAVRGAQHAAVHGAAADASARHADERAVTAVDGNICRCTGHSPIKRAIRRITTHIAAHPDNSGTPLAHLVDQNILPEYFLTIASRLAGIRARDAEVAAAEDAVTEATVICIVSGGTDLYVQKAFTMHAEPSRHILTRRAAAVITEDAAGVHVPGTATIEEFRCSPVIKKFFPELEAQLLMFGSTPIRNRGTVGGNLVNASPIGDMTCLFMALDAVLTLQDGAETRELPLRKFYSGYKQVEKKRNELIAMVSFARPGKTARLSYEKVSRRQFLDIASVNSTLSFDLEDGRMANVGISAGGVGPTMLHLAKASEMLNGKKMDARLFTDAWAVASGEISPISDARGSAAYKRLLLRQLLAAHVMKFFPGAVTKEALV